MHIAFDTGNTHPPASGSGMSSNLSRQVTMSSAEIAELTEKQHKNVIRDIREMLDELEKDGSDLSHVREEKDARGYTAAFHLDKELTETLLTGYSVPLRRRVIARLAELESRRLNALPDFSNPAAAARAWAEQFELQQAASQALAIAAPKAAFVDQYVVAAGSMGFRQVAKLLHANERQFRQMLLDKGAMYYLAGVLTPYSHHQDAGRFEVKTGTSTSNGHAFNQARFTSKGVQWVAGLWADYQIRAVV